MVWKLQISGMSNFTSAENASAVKIYETELQVHKADNQRLLTTAEHYK
jgi:hypothetical protein